MKQLVVWMLAVLMTMGVWSCQNNQSQKTKAEQALTEEKPATQQKAVEEEKEEKALFENKVAMYSQWDEDANGQLTQDEFIKGMNALFDEIDTNHNGKIEPEEWEHFKSNAKDELAAEKVLFLEKTSMYSQMGDKDKWHNKITELFAQLDKNNNGTIEKTEYIQALK